MKLLSIALCLAFVMSIAAQDASTSNKKKALPKAISDNSFLIEEAYNQEKDVMQTITNCISYWRPTHDIACSVTQEFPVRDETHQLSYTIPFSWLESRERNGVGDILINYRYQWKGDGDWAYIAPRVSLILPTGNASKELGSRSLGLQFNLPISRRENKYFVWHANAGATFLPKAKAYLPDGSEVRRGLSFVNLGGSAILLAHPNANLMLEYVENLGQAVDDTGKRKHFVESTINPGARFAINLGSLQVVPGFSVPVSFRDGESRTGLLFYLSFEHPFRRSK